MQFVAQEHREEALVLLGSRVSVYMSQESGTEGLVWVFVQDMHVYNQRPWFTESISHVLGVRQYFKD